jgi:predicted nuclease of restriction endonuclease-like RecB superfamily
MLTGKQIRIRLGRDRVLPQYLDQADPSWLEIAERLLALYRGREGATRGEIEDDVAETFGDGPSQLVYQGLAKLLEDRCTFAVDAPHPPEQLREAVFQASAATRKGEGPFDRNAILQGVAGPLQLEAAQVDAGLFADLKSAQNLVHFDDITPERLVQRYNVALAQAVLYKAVGVRAWIRGESPARLRQLLRSVKFHRLVCEIERSADSLCLRLDGPLSLFSATQKYGFQLALFLPAVLNCRDYEVHADLRWGPQRKPKKFLLTPRDGLVSHLADTAAFVPPELKMFADLFRKKIADWELLDETDVHPLGDSFWVPDFQLVQRATGQRVTLEILGFWRKSSALKHLERLRQHAGRPFLLAVSDSLHVDDADLEGLPASVHRFRQMPLPDEVARLADELLRGTKS